MAIQVDKTVSVGTIISIIVVFSSFIFGYAVFTSKVESNAQKITQNTERDLRFQEQTTEDIKELRDKDTQLLIITTEVKTMMDILLKHNGIYLEK
jgi:type II secretory pathway component PulC